MKKVLVLAAFVGLGAFACGGGAPSNQQLATDCANGPGMAMCGFYTTDVCNSIANASTDGGPTCTNANDIATQTDNCFKAVHSSADCDAFNTCMSNVPHCMM